MAFTYDGTAIFTSSASRIRFLIGDTEERRMLLDDDELAAMLTNYGTADAAAVPAIRAAIKKARHQVNWSSGSEREDASQRLPQLEATLDDLIKEGFADPTKATGGLRVAQFVRPVQGNTTNSEFA